MPEEVIQPEATPTQDGAGMTEAAATPQEPAGKKKKIEFDADAQALFNAKIDEAYGRAWSKAEKTFGGQLVEAQAKVETLVAELTALKSGKTEQPKAEEKKPSEANKDVEKLMAQVAELQEGLKLIKGERDTLKSTLETEQSQRRVASMKDKFMSAIPPGVSFFDSNEVYSLIKEQNQLQLDENGSLVVINPATGNPRLGRDMEPMQPSDYIAEFASKRPYLVRAESVGGTGGGESRRAVSKQLEEKSIKDLTADELEAKIQAIKNMAR